MVFTNYFSFCTSLIIESVIDEHVIKIPNSDNNNTSLVNLLERKTFSFSLSLLFLLLLQDISWIKDEDVIQIEERFTDLRNQPLYHPPSIMITVKLFTYSNKIFADLINIMGLALIIEQRFTVTN